MKTESSATKSLSRRSLLSRAAGAVGTFSALHSTGSARGQTQSAQAKSRTRVRESFDFDWNFFKGDVPGAQQPGFPDNGWRSLDLPHDWSIEGPFSESERAQGSLPTGIGWYRKRFRLPESDRDRIVSIEFDGVYENSEVWINGQFLGKRPYGYVNFSYDLTPHLRFGAVENVVAVKVDNSKQRNSRWYFGSGIPAHVAAGHRQAARGLPGRLRDDAPRFGGIRGGSDQDQGPE